MLGVFNFFRRKKGVNKWNKSRVGSVDTNSLLSNKLFTNGRTLMLAYDQGLEHGPGDFDLRSVNPEFVFELAEKAGVNALITEIGVAEKYASSFNVPLVIKLNGKTSLNHNNIISRQVCSLKRALKFNPVGVGYTVYPGSSQESLMFSEFSRIVEEAHDNNLPVLLWSYPRNENNTIDELSTGTIAYAARIALELGADVVKLKYNGDFEGFKWVVRNAGRTRVVIAGGHSVDPLIFLRNVEDVLKAGACGVTVGRNVWQHSHPDRILEALKRIIFNNESADVVFDKVLDYPLL